MDGHNVDIGDSGDSFANFATKSSHEKKYHEKCSKIARTEL